MCRPRPSRVNSRQVIVSTSLARRVRSAEAAKSYLEYRLSCPRENPFDGCPALAKEINRRLKVAGLCMQASDNHAMGAHEGHCWWA